MKNATSLLGELTLKVILDSNFLFIPSQFRIDIFDELLNLLNQQFEPILLSVTRQEILTMAKKGSPKVRKHALLALKLAQKCRIVQVEQGVNESHDDVIVRTAQKWKCPVATNDRMLRKRLRSKGIPVIFLREKARLALEGTF
jgi:hypothetical protein